ncbi:hypothetical protein CMV_023673 [Castanea mollissima]|uniref:ABC transporter domain-containing protein n=1 Tax=Castanea mollissima TaxID=60419 RepID=A0A8J4QK54_9ROSI|nr:hypothetical protein CMV_023673 [Castanea mollissima]
MLLQLAKLELLLDKAEVENNVAYIKDGAATEEIRVATELATEWTPWVVKHKTHLSGGQKQTVSIERATSKHPWIFTSR